jgi:ATP-binding cassette subfamily E protein 1
MGIIGQNGIGKSTVVQILANNIKPNFEDFDKKYTNNEIIEKFKGNEMHKYMTKLYTNELKVNIKHQHVDKFIQYLKTKQINPTVLEYILSKSDYTTDSSWYNNVISILELTNILNSQCSTLSGGELQRLICGITFLSKGNVFIFDEPTNYLDIRQRLNVAKLIKELRDNMIDQNAYIVVIEHDLAILDYISDYVSILYGVPSAYGVISKPLNTSNGINIYFDGYIPSENMKFRQTEYNLGNLEYCESDSVKLRGAESTYDGGIVEYDNFKLTIENGTYPIEGSITVVMGRNGTGKTTFINYVAKKMELLVSHKPQYLSVDLFVNKDGTFPTVEEIMFNNTKLYTDPLFKTDVVKPMMIESIADRKLNELSGGEMQRFWIVYCLGQNAHIYLLDEPSACLDIEQRVVTTKVIKRFIVHNKKVAFVVEHDMMMAVSLGCEQNSRAIIMEEMNFTEKRNAVANKPVIFGEGINKFLKLLDITFHTQIQSNTKRPRINKQGSSKDKEQKEKEKYYD